MGMFDDLICERPLPHDRPVNGLQTKTFDCQLAKHRIDADGTLWLDRGHHEEVPKHLRPHPNDDGLLGMGGSWRWIQKPVKSDFHGVVEFIGRDDTGAFVEFEAFYTYGKLDKIVKVSATEIRENGK